MIRLTRPLRYRPPYAWAPLVAFLAARAIPGVEAVDGRAYRRVFHIDGAWGRLEVRHRPARQRLDLDVWLPDRRTIPDDVLERVARVFDVEADLRVVAEHFAADTLLGPRVRRLPGLRVPGAWDLFELGVRAILGQQVTVKGASTLAGRLVSLCGRSVNVGVPGLSHLFPRPEDVASADLSALGVPARRRESLQAFATACASGAVSAVRADLDEALLALPGFGDWTVQDVLMRACGEPDAFPASDSVAAADRRRGQRQSPGRASRGVAAVPRLRGPLSLAGTSGMTLPDLVSALVAIDSVNPTLIPGAAGERAVTEFVATWLRERGVAVTEISSGLHWPRAAEPARPRAWHRLGPGADALRSHRHRRRLGHGRAVHAGAARGRLARPRRL